MATSVTTGRNALTFGSVVFSEWIKLRSLRSTWLITLIVLVGMTAVSAALFAFAQPTANDSPPFLAVDSTVRVIAQIDVIFAVILGTLFITLEYSSQSIMTTLNAVPRRLLLLSAKATVVAISVFILTAIAALASTGLGAILLDFRGYDLAWDEAPRILVGCCLYDTLFALMALFFGTLMCSGVAAIATSLSLIWVAPALVGLVANTTVGEAILIRLPGVAGAQVFSRAPATATGGAWGGFAILLVEVACVAVAAAAVFRRRDL